jgi:hypothetical protein
MLSTLQSGMDDSTLAYVFNVVGYPQLVKHFGSEDWRLWDAGKCPVRIVLVRPKNDCVPLCVRYYSFLDLDAVEAIKDWLHVRPGHLRTYPPKNPQSTVFDQTVLPECQNRG